MIPEAAKVIEEASELIQAVCKCERFGQHNFHPDRPDSTNQTEMDNEFQDLVRAYIAYMAVVEWADE